MNIVVLAGGLSMERDVSLTSGSRIANTLRDAGHNAVLVDLYYGIEKDKMNFEGISGRYEYNISETAPDLDALVKANGGRENPGILCRQCELGYCGAVPVGEAGGGLFP